jgi:hypothetical protein
MSDPFEVWRLACSTAFTRSLELLGDVFAPYAALSPPQDSYAIDLSSFPTFQRVRLDLDTMFLLEPRRSAASARPVVISGLTRSTMPRSPTLPKGTPLPGR